MPTYDERMQREEWAKAATADDMSRAIDFLYEIGVDERGYLHEGPIMRAADEAEHIRDVILEGYDEDHRLYRSHMDDLGGPCPRCGRELGVGGGDVAPWTWCDACHISYQWDCDQ